MLHCVHRISSILFLGQLSLYHGHQQGVVNVGNLGSINGPQSILLLEIAINGKARESPLRMPDVVRHVRRCCQPRIVRSGKVSRSAYPSWKKQESQTLERTQFSD